VQNDLPPLFLEESRYEIPSLGQHLPIRIPLGPQQGKYGYLSYTLAENIIHFNDLKKAERELEIVDHISGTTRIVPLRALGNYSLRDVRAESS
jgi:hypothetical protein